ncbi:Uncharacterised protein [Mycobacterium tuberculosis]|nr:Uncharacterised protein [Mycobacterium tuberculosis]
MPSTKVVILISCWRRSEAEMRTLAATPGYSTASLRSVIWSGMELIRLAMCLYCFIAASAASMASRSSRKSAAVSWLPRLVSTVSASLMLLPCR